MRLKNIDMYLAKRRKSIDKNLAERKKCIDMLHQGLKKSMIAATNLIKRVQTKMLLVKPILTDAALDHLYLLLKIWIWIKALTDAILTFEIMVV